jgi:hypothetical protein
MGKNQGDRDILKKSAGALDNLPDSAYIMHAS